jgi:chromosomal replication initiation ATPase DnaA
MQLDMIEQYDSQTKSLLQDLRSSIVQHLSQSVDSKKIISFLAKVTVIGLDDLEKKIYIGVPNEFVLTQVKKFFQKEIQEAVHAVYNNQFDPIFVVYADLHGGKHPLIVDVKKLLQINEKTKKTDISPSMKNTLSEYFGILFDPNYTFDTFVV